MSKEVFEKLNTEFADFKKTVLEFVGKFKKQMKFAEMMTSDGKMLSVEGELAEGAAVMLDGAAAPDGAYTLEDGTTCNVKDGKIESIVKPDMNYDEKFAAIEKRFSDFEQKFEENSQGIAGQFEELGKTLTTITEQMGKQLELVGKFAAQAPDPAEQPTSRKEAKMLKEATAGKDINQILTELNIK